MSRDVANMIWELAKNDRNLQGLQLKKMFYQKMRLDEEKIREELKVVIAEKIKTTIQPLNASLVLTGDRNSWGNQHYTGMIGGTATLKKTSETVVKDKFEYLDGCVWKISNSETQFLIESVIIPMDLNWSIKEPGCQNNIIVSWKHWKDARDNEC